MPLPPDFDWTSSRTHILFLTQFQERNLDTIFTDQQRRMAWNKLWEGTWTSMLQESPEQAYQRLMSAGALDQKIDVETGQMIYNRTQVGNEAIAKYWASHKQQEAIVMQQTIGALKSHDYLEAIRLVTDFERYSWHSYGMGADEAILQTIFTYEPKSFANRPSEVLEQFRVAASINYLWLANSYGGSDFQVNEAFGLVEKDLPTVRMFVSYAILKSEIADHKSKGLQRITIANGYDGYYGGFEICNICQSVKDQIYALDETPEIPHEECLCKYGCRCWVYAQNL